VMNFWRQLLPTQQFSFQWQYFLISSCLYDDARRSLGDLKRAVWRHLTQ
jgi:hypothetical protein